jgi:hypothetical protein
MYRGEGNEKRVRNICELLLSELKLGVFCYILTVESVVCPLYEFLYAFKIVKLFLNHPVYFPFPVSGKILLYIILKFSTCLSFVPIKCQALFPYRITNIYILMPLPVVVVLCVNPTATVCYSLCLLVCSPH